MVIVWIRPASITPVHFDLFTLESFFLLIRRVFHIIIIESVRTFAVVVAKECEKKIYLGFRQSDDSLAACRSGSVRFDALLPGNCSGVEFRVRQTELDLSGMVPERLRARALIVLVNTFSLHSGVPESSCYNSGITIESVHATCMLLFLHFFLLSPLRLQITLGTLVKCCEIETNLVFFSAGTTKKCLLSASKIEVAEFGLL